MSMTSNQFTVERTLLTETLYLQSVLGEDLFNLNDFYFAGGCIYSLWNGKEVKDYDIFCTNKKALKRIKKYFRANKDKITIKTRNAITMGKYQFVLRNVGLPEKEVAQFDFKHNMNYYDADGFHSISGIEYLNGNQLVANTERMRDILSTVSRIPKFMDRGMEICQSDVVDMLELATRPSKYVAERRSIVRKRRNRGVY